MAIPIKYYGHSCFMINIGGKNILFDPFITPNPKASSIDISTIMPDVIAISHGHGDHVADVESIAKQSGATIISVYEITEWLQNKGVENLIPMNTGGNIDLGTCKIKVVNAIHSSSLPDGTYGGNPVGFVVQSNTSCFYYAGDTALSVDMKLISEQFNLDFAILPIGDHFTMGVDDAIKAAQFVNCKQVIGMHFDTFPPIEINHAAATQAFADKNIKLILPEINQTIEL